MSSRQDIRTLPRNSRSPGEFIGAPPGGPEEAAKAEGESMGKEEGRLGEWEGREERQKQVKASGQTRYGKR